jgi:aryl-alcohol dehydrogenase-like predicted oxidoreductase
MINRLALGTVHFGMQYGVSNIGGQVDLKNAGMILKYARDTGINTLDTAIVYGESEQNLGALGVEDWNVISKLPKLSCSQENVTDIVNDFVIGSLERLRIPKLHGLLLHNSNDLLGPHSKSLYQAIADLKRRGLIEKFGISVYDPQDLDRILSIYPLDIVQAPFNVLDRRLATSGWLARLHDMNIEIHIRSVFLQGLLLMEHTKRPVFFKRWDSLWKTWHDWLYDEGLSPLQACLGFVNSYSEVNKIIVGVNSVKQLKQINVALGLDNVLPPETLISRDVGLINPSNWNL